MVTHDPLEHFPQAATGYQRVTQGMERGGADEARYPQADGRVAAGLHRQLPQARGGRQRITGIGIVHPLWVEAGLAAELRAVEPEGIELFAQGARPAGEGSRFRHADWRFRSTGWRSRLKPVFLF
ncbi:hypothetical protein D9M73_244810 [compost metagenome]